MFCHWRCSARVFSRFHITFQSYSNLSIHRIPYIYRNSTGTAYYVYRTLAPTASMRVNRCFIMSYHTPTVTLCSRQDAPPSPGWLISSYSDCPSWKTASRTWPDSTNECVFLHLFIFVLFILIYHSRCYLLQNDLQPLKSAKLSENERGLKHIWKWKHNRRKVGRPLPSSAGGRPGINSANLCDQLGLVGSK